jgi:Protein of unknown function (DUF3000)
MRATHGVIEGYFLQFKEEMASLDLRSEVILEEVPPPSKLAPLTYAITADIPLSDDLDDISDENYATGRFVLLADSDYKEAWQGEFRAVTFVRAPIDEEMAFDPMLNDVGWSWLEDALRSEKADAIALSGTVTRVASKSYGQLAPQPDESEIEIRGSWTPIDGSKLIDHARAWITLLEMVAGVVPLPEGVTPFVRRR